MVLLQLRDPYELLVQREFLPSFCFFFSSRYMTLAVESGAKPIIFSVLPRIPDVVLQKQLASYY